MEYLLAGRNYQLHLMFNLMGHWTHTVGAVLAADRPEITLVRAQLVPAAHQEELSPGIMSSFWPGSLCPLGPTDRMHIYLQGHQQPTCSSGYIRPRKARAHTACPKLVHREQSQGTEGMKPFSFISVILGAQGPPPTHSVEMLTLAYGWTHPDHRATRGEISIGCHM